MQLILYLIVATALLLASRVRAEAIKVDTSGDEVSTMQYRSSLMVEKAADSSYGAGPEMKRRFKGRRMTPIKLSMQRQTDTPALGSGSKE
jgi:hypothetical protein